MSVVVTARVPEDLAAWADEYAGSRDVPRAVIVEAAIGHFRELCASGVPDLPEARSKGRPRKVSQAVAPEPMPARPRETHPDVGQVSRVFAERGPIDYGAAARERQERLNAAKYGRRS